MPLAPTLPGVAFEAVPRPLDESLPRMDVCGFVGFASRGPIDVPVVVEDAVSFREVFGADVQLARTDDGIPVVSHLGGAVTAFFANGGRRAWVVRVASSGAVTNRFAVPGLLVPGPAADSAAGWTVATLPARSAGAWSDGISVGATLEVSSVVADVLDANHVVVDHGVDITVGDVVAVDVDDSTAVVARVLTVAPADAGVSITLDLDTAHRIRAQLLAAPPPTAEAHRLTGDDPVAIPSFAVDDDDPDVPVVAVDANEDLGPGDVLAVDGAEAGALLLVTLGDERFDSTDPSQRHFAVSSCVAVSSAGADWATPVVGSGAVTAEVRRVRLLVRDGEAIVAELGGLGLGSAHRRSLERLPDDERIYALIAGIARSAPGDDPTEVGLDEVVVRALDPLERECLAPRFPLAGSAPAPMLLTLGMATDPTETVFGPPPGGVAVGSAPERNGLEAFAADLFVDGALAGLGVDTIMSTAWDLTSVQHPPRRLRGVHGLATNDDVTLVCVPDAVHTGWDRISVPPPPPLTAPHLEVAGVDTNGTHLAWSAVDGATHYVAEHDPSVTFADATRHETIDTTQLVEPADRCPATRFHRVRAERGDEVGPWSNVVVAMASATEFAACAPPDIDLPPAEPTTEPAPDQVVWRARTAAEAEPWNELRAVQSAVLRWCGSRGDVFAVLALPQAFTSDAARRHVAELTGSSADTASAAPFLDGGVPRLTGAERGVLGYGAAYHPWPVIGWPGDDGDVRPLPPDGSIAGTYAHVAIGRGAWIAPGRRALASTLALTPHLADDRLLAMSLAGVNPIDADPSGFMSLTASTMADVAAIRPVNVRRLIMLLRRLARREGIGIVFEPNDRELQRLVHMRFERILTSMYRRGAFAGATAAEAFDVSTGSAVNPPESVDAGRFVVEVRFAPSRPLEFVTVRLVVSGNMSGEERL